MVAVPAGQRSLGDQCQGWAKNSPRDCIVGDCIFCGVEFHVLIVHARNDKHAKSC
jgi:hypothetical protein